MDIFVFTYVYHFIDHVYMGIYIIIDLLSSRTWYKWKLRFFRKCPLMKINQLDQSTCISSNSMLAESHPADLSSGWDLCVCRCFFQLNLLGPERLRLLSDPCSCVCLQEKADLGELNFSLCYLPTAGRLTATVIKATNLKAMDLTGFSGEQIAHHEVINTFTGSGFSKNSCFCTKLPPWSGNIEAFGASSDFNNLIQWYVTISFRH